MSEIGYLGLGSNVGDRRANLQAAVELLWAHDVAVLLSSSVYETEPVGEVLDQRAFSTRACASRRALEPEALLDACKAVERALGRERRARPATSATGRGRSTSTCCCSATSTYRVRAADAAAPRGDVAALRARAAARARPAARACPARGRAADALERARRPGRAPRRAAAGRAVRRCCSSSTSATPRRTSAPSTASELVEHWRFATVRESTADELGAALRNLLALRGMTLRRHRRVDRLLTVPAAAAGVDGDGRALPRPRDAASSARA